jgi:hypothetical protein
MSTVPKKPLTLEVGDVIAAVPATGERCERILTEPPVRFEDDVELEYRERGRPGRMVVDRRTPVVVDVTHRERRHKAMTSGEEHYALVWLRKHEPRAFDRAADYVDRIRDLDNGARKETR